MCASASVRPNSSKTPQPQSSEARLPKVTLIGGPNGSGKSTLIRDLRELGANFGDHFNADEIAKTLGPPSEGVSREAQAMVRAARDQALLDRRDYSWETVMSHESHIAHLRQARRAGYEVELIYIATEDPAVNVGRVAERVERGEHDVPEARILDRYEKSIAQLSHAIPIAHEVRVFDNSSDDFSYKLIAWRDGDFLEALPRTELPGWFLRVLADLESPGHR